MSCLHRTDLWTLPLINYHPIKPKPTSDVKKQPQKKSQTNQPTINNQNNLAQKLPTNPYKGSIHIPLQKFSTPPTQLNQALPHSPGTCPPPTQPTRAHGPVDLHLGVPCQLHRILQQLRCLRRIPFRHDHLRCSIQGATNAHGVVGFLPSLVGGWWFHGVERSLEQQGGEGHDTNFLWGKNDGSSWFRNDNTKPWNSIGCGPFFRMTNHCFFWPGIEPSPFTLLGGGHTKVICLVASNRNQKKHSKHSWICFEGIRYTCNSMKS